MANAAEEWTLYVAHDAKRPDRYAVGSALCLRTLELLPDGIVDVQEVFRGNREEYPPWLTGTPTLAPIDGGDVWRGHNALAKLQQIAVESARRKDLSGKTSSTAVKSSLKARPSQGTGALPSGNDPDQQATSPAVDLWTVTEDVGDDVEETTLQKKITADDLRDMQEKMSQK